MAFRFRLAETFEEGCQRIAREQIERAQAQLKGPDDVTTAVHETRKSLKRLRALLRLIRPAIGESVFHHENTQLREIARILSSARDRHVLLETVAKPVKQVGNVVQELGVGEPLRVLNITHPFDGRPPNGEDRVSLLIQMIRPGAELIYALR